MRRLFFCVLVFAGILSLLSADAPAPKTPKEGLRPFNDLVGSWRCTGTPAGSREEQLNNFWTETLAVEWQFKDADAWLKLDFKNGKYFKNGILRYRPSTNDYELSLQTLQKDTLSFAGPLNNRVLALERPKGDVTERFIVTLLHANRFLYRLETRPMNKTLVTKLWSVGATKEGEQFAVGAGGPECIVSGGKGTIAVSYQGRTYYVCCSGCRSEFLEHPQKYIDEYEAKKKTK